MSAKFPRRQEGFSLAELVIAIMIVGVALGGMLNAYEMFARHASAPMLRKQALAIAESLLEEIRLMPFPFCDPDDAEVFSAKSTAECSTKAEPTKVAKTRATAKHVGDYNGLRLSPYKDWTDTNALDGYTATVAVTEASLGSIAASDSLLIKVTVTQPDGDAVVLDGYRTRHSPNTP